MNLLTGRSTIGSSDGEVGVARFRIVVEFFERSVELLGAAFDDDSTICHQPGKVKVLFREENGKTFPLQPLDRLRHLFDDDGGYAFGRLIE